MDEPEEYICPDCAGSGEGLCGPPGTGTCRRCKGTGSIREGGEEGPSGPEYDEDDEERIRVQFKARGYNYLGKGRK
jgi:DnaJ-class molecular chaperone